MIEIDTNSIKEIAEQLECNFRAYIHKKNGQMIFIPNEDVMPVSYTHLDVYKRQGSINGIVVGNIVKPATYLPYCTASRI